MKTINAHFSIITEESIIKNLPKLIEQAGRTCYQSSHRITETSAEPFVEMIIKRGHESVLEHGVITVRVITNRGVSHELVRHRIGSYSQESTRFCNYGSNDVLFIDPRIGFKYHKKLSEFPDDTKDYIANVMEESYAKSEESYKRLLEEGIPPEIARDVLPNGLKTDIVITYNLRQWREFFRQRTAEVAHPEMREITLPLLERFKELLPCVFSELLNK